MVVVVNEGGEVRCVVIVVELPVVGMQPLWWVGRGVYRAMNREEWGMRRYLKELLFGAAVERLGESSATYPALCCIQRRRVFSVCLEGTAKYKDCDTYSVA